MTSTSSSLSGRHDGIVTRQRDFSSWSQAVEEAGLDPVLLGRLREMEPGSVLEFGG